jgi:beta-aspartyl-peptidase (threonine type)
MELDEYFNAGYGAVLTSEGNIEMDASIMDGSNLKVGCVTGVTNIQHPISLARKVMEKTPHNFLASTGVMDFAKEQGFEILPEGALVTDYAMESWLEWKESQVGGAEFSGRRFGEVGTVGAVAYFEGNIAVATSTGGMTGKWPGRVGDTPIIGSGFECPNISELFQ